MSQHFTHKLVRDTESISLEQRTETGRAIVETHVARVREI
jgi:hypothetical protein